MEDFLDESVSEEDLRVIFVHRMLNTIYLSLNLCSYSIFMLILLFVRQKFERRYHDALAKGTVTNTIQFEYAWCLIRSKYPTDIKRGIFLLEDLLKSGSESARRDCLYYLAIGNSKVKVRPFPCSTLLEYKRTLHIFKSRNIQKLLAIPKFYYKLNQEIGKFKI